MAFRKADVGSGGKKSDKRGTIVWTSTKEKYKYG